MELNHPVPPADGIDTVVLDYGGVLTNPLAETFTEFGVRTGLDLQAVGTAFAAATARYGISPMAELEVAAITEQEFTERLLAELPLRSAAALGGRPFGELWFQGRRANAELVDFVRQLKSNGYRTALLTNNVVEWRPRWQATLPVAEIFDVVVDSSAERVRKPDPELYLRLLRRLDTPAGRCLFIDDTAENLDAAARLGFHTVLFENTAQTIREVSERLTAQALRELSNRLGHPLVEDLGRPADGALR
ncbi:HAD-IA family hydrolase [Kitasatospora putterlickiae]|uniref:HAD-IA family hydrolase n=1 Tax=Kitasatospora putterlickiae TaxID=221725 RepID=A0ABN1YCL0_9ACTN